VGTQDGVPGKTEEMTPEEKEAMIPEAESLDRRFQAERDYTKAAVEVVMERLAGMDRATALLDESVNRVPTEVTKEVTHLRELTEEHFGSIAQQFTERDVRTTEAATAATTAIAAAFAAQKEAAAEQNKANTKAIDKSEAATSETIKQITASFNSKHESLTEKVDDVKTRMNGTEGRSKGVTENRTENRANINVWIGAIGAVIAMALLLLAYQASRSHTTVVPDQAPAVTVTTPGN
jgi:hypothetical protein